jgi:hypothetical protein
MESELSESKHSKLTPAEMKKLLEDREKAKQYIKSCKEIIAKQSDQLKSQQASFKESLSNLETQQYNSRFHAVGIKLELETHKIYMIFYKKYRLTLANGFFTFKFKLHPRQQSKKYVPLEIKTALKNMIFAFKLNHRAVVRHSWKRIRGRIEKNPEKINNEIVKVEKENKELKFRIAKTKVKTEINPALQELMEENKSLKEKIQNSEESVELFIKEMSNLLDKHEPPGFSEEVERIAQKNKRTVRLGNKSKSKNSPERSEFPRKSVDRKLHCD